MARLSFLALSTRAARYVLRTFLHSASDIILPFLSLPFILTSRLVLPLDGSQSGQDTVPRITQSFPVELVCPPPRGPYFPDWYCWQSPFAVIRSKNVMSPN